MNVLTSYPEIDVLSAPSQSVYERHRTALGNELLKQHPRKDVVVELMMHTYVPRREFVLGTDNRFSVIFDEWQGFCFPDVVSYMAS